CVEVAREIDHETGERLAMLRQKNPAEFERVMRVAGRRLMAMAQLKQRDPALYRVKISELSQDMLVKNVASQLRQALRTNDTGQIDSLKIQLHNVLRIQQAMWLKSRGEYVCRLE